MMKRQASRIGDGHTCPKREPEPHVGGPIFTGCSTVTIERLAAARAGDSANCSCATDVIAEGAATVWIGGMPAARLGERSVHGGRIVGGAKTVFIGGASMAGPGVDDIAANVAEADRIRRRGPWREERRRRAQAYIDELYRRKRQSAWEKFLKEDIPNIIMQDGDLPPGALDFTEEEAKAFGQALEERRLLDEALKNDKERLEELERQNAARRNGRSVDPTDAKPGLHDPVVLPVTREEL
jgi:uncharacterized Zn-binding protein involved in type VI secretion